MSVAMDSSWFDVVMVGGMAWSARQGEGVALTTAAKFHPSPGARHGLNTTPPPTYSLHQRRQGHETLKGRRRAHLRQHICSVQSARLSNNLASQAHLS